MDKGFFKFHTLSCPWFGEGMKRNCATNNGFKYKKIRDNNEENGRCTISKRHQK